MKKLLLFGFILSMVIPAFAQQRATISKEMRDVKVNVRQSTVLSLEIVNMMGQKVYTVETGIANRGMNEITIDASNLTTGIYFYTVRAGETAITKKMIVE